MTSTGKLDRPEFHRRTTPRHQVGGVVLAQIPRRDRSRAAGPLATSTTGLPTTATLGAWGALFESADIIAAVADESAVLSTAVARDATLASKEASALGAIKRGLYASALRLLESDGG